MPQPLLEGEYVEPTADTEELREEISRLEGELRKARMEINKARGDNANYESAITALRQQLSPLHRALRAVFGEIELVAGEESSVPSATAQPTAASNAQPSSAWEKWKQKLGGKKAEIIDALQSHPMSRDQVRVATSSGWSTVDEGLAYLRNVGLVEKVGNKYQLKTL